MKIHIVQHDILTLQPEENLAWILAELESEASREAMLTVFPACTLCGSPLFAAAGYRDIQKRAQAALQELVAHSEHRAFLVGLPLQIQDKGLCNAIVFVQNGAIRATVTKKYLQPDESRCFVRGEGVQVVQFHDQSLAIGFYEDLKELTKGHVEQPDMVICCGCNVFDYQRPYRTRYRMAKTVELLGAGLVYVNRTGGEGPYLFAGGSLAMNAAGGVLAQMPYFEESCETVDLQLIETIEDSKPEAVELVYKGLVTGLRDYFRKNGLQRAVLGLSGGVDSALVATLAVDALGADNVYGLLMPSQYSTDHSVSDAVALAENLGIKYGVVPIRPVFDALREAMQPIFENRAEDVTEENMQARVRGMMVMSYANKFGALALNTTNRSEAAMGYGTLYGDSCGSLAVIGDLYKTEVYELCEFINNGAGGACPTARIPQHTIDKAPSAELRPGQKDSDSLPDYEQLDAILALYLDDSLCEEEIVEDGYDAEVVKMVINKVKRNEWKRLQFAPQIKVSPVSFGLDRRWPIS
ncbi:MAG: NAD(+) synthase [Bacteroidales bacterium]|nr:NAD(+) synthase [Bacteroidales bacterium]